jgi:hypothetical protein
MEHYAGIDVSLERSSVCVVDSTGRIVREAKVPSEPEALVGFFAGLGVAVTRIGLEAGPLSQWLHAGQRRNCCDIRLPWRAAQPRRPFSWYNANKGFGRLPHGYVSGIRTEHK